MEQLTNYPSLVDQIGELLRQGKEKAIYSVNTVLVQTYWQIGKYIVIFEQQGNEKAVYGSQLIDRLAADLTAKYGKGFGRSNLLYIRKLYLNFQNSGTPSHYLTLSHYYEILKADKDLEISSYTKQSEKER